MEVGEPDDQRARIDGSGTPEEAFAKVLDYTRLHDLQLVTGVRIEWGGLGYTTPWRRGPDGFVAVITWLPNSQGPKVQP